VTLGIITKGNHERPKLPFFSRVAIRYAKKQNTRLGYSFNNKHIQNLKEKEATAE